MNEPVVISRELYDNFDRGIQLIIEEQQLKFIDDATDIIDDIATHQELKTGADITPLKNKLTATLSGHVKDAETAAGTRTKDFVKEVIRLHGEELAASVLPVNYTNEHVSALVDDFIEKLYTGTGSSEKRKREFKDSLINTIAKAGNWASQETTALAVKKMHEKGSKVRWARITKSSHACNWCRMLASRGFVYKSSNSGSAGSHKKCACRCVPGYPDRTRIEGYDLEGQNKRRIECAEFVGVDPHSTNYEDLKRVVDAIANRDPRWFATGKRAKIDVNGIVFKDLNKQQKKDYIREMKNYNILAEHGFRVKIVDNPHKHLFMDGRVQPIFDVYLGNNQAPYEMKTPDGERELLVDTNIHKIAKDIKRFNAAVSKYPDEYKEVYGKQISAMEPRGILSNVNTEIGDDKFIKLVENSRGRRMKEGKLNQLSVIKKDETLRQYWV